MYHLLVDWVDEFLVLHCLPNSARADGNLAEAAGQGGKRAEHPNQSKPNPCPRADGTPCTIEITLSRRRLRGEIGHTDVGGVVEAEAYAQDEHDRGGDLDGEAAKVREAGHVGHGHDDGGEDHEGHSEVGDEDEGDHDDGGEGEPQVARQVPRDHLRGKPCEDAFFD